MHDHERAHGRATTGHHASGSRRSFLRRRAVTPPRRASAVRATCHRRPAPQTSLKPSPSGCPQPRMWGTCVPIVITVSNVGTDPAENVTLRDTPPGAGRIVHATGFHATRHKDGTVTWNLGDLAPRSDADRARHDADRRPGRRCRTRRSSARAMPTRSCIARPCAPPRQRLRRSPVDLKRVAVAASSVAAGAMATACPRGFCGSGARRGDRLL